MRKKTEEKETEIDMGEIRPSLYQRTPEELEENQRSDMLLRFKDWTCTAIYHIASQV